MGYIKKMRLVNFQSHRETEIVFDKGLTVIVGQTDQGKSSIIRALKWVLYNEPRGTDFITAGENFCQVTIEMSDGTTIIRERDGQKNKYVLIKDGEKQIFEGFGSNIPLEIIKAHGIPKIHIDKDSTSAVNLAEQLEPPFLLSESGSNRAKALGRLIGVHIIDAAQRSTIKDLLETEQLKKLINNEIAATRDELTNYDDVPELEKRVINLQSIIKKLNEKKEYFLKLLKIKSEIKNIEKEIDISITTISKLCFIDDLEKAVLKIESLSLRYTHLLEIKNKFDNLRLNTEKEQLILNKTYCLPELESIYLQISKLNYKNQKLCNIKKDFDITNKQIEYNHNIQQVTKDVFLADNLIKEITELTGKNKKLQTLQQRLRFIDDQMNIYQNDIKKCKAIEQINTYLEEISVKTSRLLTLEKINKHLLDVENSIDKGNAYLTQITKNLYSLTKLYGLNLIKLSKCPTCLNPIDNKMAENIVAKMLSINEE